MGDVVNIARLQFAITTIYHFFFVPLTIGLSLLIAIMETMYVKTGNEKYKVMTKFWGKLFLINFALGVVTGLVQEFQFGMNWSDYSRYVGDIFGVPLAIEALLAFFLESTFLGIWIFGWDKVSKKIHLLSIWIVAIATSVSAFWILTANSFMHEPAGYVINNGRAELTSFKEVITTGHLWLEFPHTMLAAMCTAGFFVIGISAYHMLKNNNVAWVKTSFKIGAITAIIAAIGVAGAGDAQGKYLARNIPMKIAAAEALWETEQPADFSIISIIDEKNKENKFELKIPKALSFMATGSFNGEVKGINDIQAQYENQYGPGNYIPPITISFYTFRIMVAAGMAMILLGLVACFMLFKKKLLSKKWILWILTLSMALPYLANAAGWILTEMTRSPWIVHGLLTIENGISPTVSLGYVWTSLIVFAALYTILAIVDISLLVKYAKVIPTEDNNGTTKNSKKEESLWT